MMSYLFYLILTITLVCLITRWPSLSIIVSICLFKNRKIAPCKRLHKQTKRKGRPINLMLPEPQLAMANCDPAVSVLNMVHVPKAWWPEFPGKRKSNRGVKIKRSLLLLFLSLFPSLVQGAPPMFYTITG